MSTLDESRSLLARCAVDLGRQWKSHVLRREGLHLAGLAGMVLLASGILRQLVVTPLVPLLVGAAGMIASLVFVLLQLRASAKSTPVLLLDADRHHGLQERLSAAWGIFQSEKAQSGIGALLMEDAARNVARVRPREVYPWKAQPLWRWVWLAIIPGLVLQVVSLEDFFDSSDRVSASWGLVERAQQLEQEARRLALPNTLLLAEELEDLGRQLARPELVPRQRRLLVQGLLERVERQIDGLERSILPEFERREYGEEGREDRNEESQGEGLVKPDSVEAQVQTLQQSGMDPSSGEQPGAQAGAPRDEARQGTINPEEIRKQLEDFLAKSSREDLQKLKEAAEDLRNAMESMVETVPEALAGDDQSDRGAQGGRQEPPQASPQVGSQANERADEEGGAGSDPLNYEVPERPMTAQERQAMEEARGTGKLSLGGAELDERDVRILLRDFPGSTIRVTDQGDLLFDYQRMNETVMIRDNIPPAMRDLVRDYYLGITGTQPGRR